MIKPSPPLPDEDVLDIPRSWKRHLHPRRGGGPGPKVKMGDLSEEGLLAPHADVIEEALNHRKTDPAIAAAARGHLAGTADPRGAAALAAILASDHYTGEMTVRFVDAWIAEHGLGFAVHAFVEQCCIEVGNPYGADKGSLVPQRGSGLNDQQLGDAAKRLRTILAAADDTGYQEVVALLAGLRTTPMRQMLSAYLVPTELDWVAECCAAPAKTMPRELLLRSLGSAEHLEMLGTEARISVSDCYYIENLLTLAEGVGPAVAPFMADAFDRHHDSAPRRKGLLEALSRLPSDEAFRLMLERSGNSHMRAALREAMRRSPVRAIRVLATATAAGDATAEELLTDHLRADSELVTRVLPDLPAEVRAVVEKPAALEGVVPEASADELPPLLVDPPWARTEPKRKPVVLKGLTAPGEQTVVWEPGECDAWLRTAIADPTGGGVTVQPVQATARRDATWEKRLAEIRAGVASDPLHRMAYWQAAMLAKGPEELARPAVREWTPSWHQSGLGTRNAWSPDHWLKPLIARFGLDALPVTLSFARARPARGAELLLPFLDGEVADAMAGWLLRVASAHGPAAAWFARHGQGVLPHLLPAALGRAGRARAAAENALCFLAAQEGESAVLAAARPHGEQAVALVEALLAEHPAEPAPQKKAPDLSSVNAEALPQVLLSGGERALPLPAVRHLLALLAISASGEEPDPGLSGVLEACDERSLAEFGWELFRTWREDGASPRNVWRFTALGWLGDDEAVRRLVPLIRAWPGDGGHHHAVRGLDVLAQIATDLALREIHAIAQKVKYKGLKARAQDKVAEVAAARGLTPEQLGDRLVPGFGLDAAGALVLDYGPRRFTAGFDEALRPYVVGEDGKRRANLPSPGARDDAALAPAAHRRFADLKKDVRAIAGIQLQRLELAMTTGRRWSPAEFQEFFVRHPLVWHIARRLVWLAENGGTTTAFRLAEDRTFADVTDSAVAPPVDAAIGIAHPLHLGDTLDGWSQLFADYEMLQPFPQLGREVHALTDEEKAAGRLTRFEKVTVPFGNVLRLERRGWFRGPTNSDGGIECFVRPVGEGRCAVVSLETGLFVGYVRESGDQTFEAVWIGADPAPDRPSYPPVQGAPHTFGELDPVTASEVIADLEEASAV